MNATKLLRKALAGGKNLRFAELTALVEAFGFELVRVTGSHHILEHPDIPELINLQDAKGKAKPCQVKQVLNLIEENNLELGGGA